MFVYNDIICLIPAYIRIKVEYIDSYGSEVSNREGSHPNGDEFREYRSYMGNNPCTCTNLC
ncbi:hypothetical protein BN903_46 [Halorubrum sp. AJ67]|nr:hypothetical protein BN903_46 [Halorubrum sp. AJ67]